MSEHTETRHQKTVDSFEHLISFCAGYVDYNPVSADLIIVNLNTKLIAARASLHVAITARIAYENVLVSCGNAITEIHKTVKRLIPKLRVKGANTSSIGKAKIVLDKLISDNRTLLQMPGDAVITNTEATALLYRQDKHLEHLNILSRSFVSEMSAVVLFDNDVSALDKKLCELQTVSAELMSAFHALKHAHNSRNEILYNKQTGLITRANRVKEYVKTVLGNESFLFNEISKLPFAESTNLNFFSHQLFAE